MRQKQYFQLNTICSELKFTPKNLYFTRIKSVHQWQIACLVSWLLCYIFLYAKVLQWSQVICELKVLCSMTVLSSTECRGNNMSVLSESYNSHSVEHWNVWKSIIPSKYFDSNKIEIRPINALLEVWGFTTFSIYLVFQFEWHSYWVTL